MNLYKFRALNNETDLYRAWVILTTGKFYCQKFSEFNDIKEGVFWYNPDNVDLDNIASIKANFKICCFSEDLNSELMWGYYANGYKGIAIEIAVPKPENDIVQLYPEFSGPIEYSSHMRKIKYDAASTVCLNNPCNIGEQIIEILSHKNKIWKHEKEWRFITSETDKQQTIGKIKAVYFGKPYGKVDNCVDIMKHSASISSYIELRKQLITICNLKLEKGSDEKYLLST
jgi:hypothetical protein